MTKDDREAARQARAALQKANRQDRVRRVKEYVADHKNWQWMITATLAAIVSLIVAWIGVG